MEPSRRGWSVRQRLLVGLLTGRLDGLELAAGFVIGQAHLVIVPVDHPTGEVLKLGPLVQVLQEANLVALLLVLGPGEEGLARSGGVARGVAVPRGGGRR